MLSAHKDFSVDSLIGAAYDSYLPWFARTLPALIKAWDGAPDSDPMKSKQLGKALSDLAEEGVAQVFRRMMGADWLVGVVGQLQLEVLSSRIGSEYGVPICASKSVTSMLFGIALDEGQRGHEGKSIGAGPAAGVELGWQVAARGD